MSHRHPKRKGRILWAAPALERRVQTAVGKLWCDLHPICYLELRAHRGHGHLSELKAKTSVDFLPESSGAVDKESLIMGGEDVRWFFWV